MNKRAEGTIAIIAALLVLFSALWEPLISVGISIVSLAAMGIYKYFQKDR